MSKAVKVTLVIATICIVLGLITTGLAFSIASFDIRQFSNASSAVENHYTSTRSDYSEISISGVSENYRIVRGTGERLEVTYWEDNQTFFSFREQGSTLVIREEHKIKLFSFNFSFFGTETVIELPAGFTGTLRLTVVSGGVTIVNVGECDSLYISTTSGDIRCDGVYTSKEFSVTSVSGDVRCAGAQANRASFKTTSGSIKVSELAASTISVSSVSGDIEASVKGAATGFKISASSISGRVTVPQGNSNAAGSISMGSVSGDVRLSFVR